MTCLTAIVMFNVYSFRIRKYSTPISTASYTCYSNYYLMVDDHTYIAVRRQFFFGRRYLLSTHVGGM